MNNEIEDEPIVVNNIIELNAPSTDAGKEKLGAKTYTRVPKEILRARTYTRVPKNTGVPEPAYKCETCYSNFTAYDDFRQHKLIFHNDTRDIQMPEVFESTSNATIEMFEIPDIVNEAAIQISKNQDMDFETPIKTCETQNVCDAANFNPEAHDDVVQTPDDAYIEPSNIVNETLGAVQVKKKYKKKLDCGICGSSRFRTRKTLNQHVRKDHGFKDFRSDWRRFHSRDISLNSVISIPTPKIVTANYNTKKALANNKFPCDQCNFIFNSDLGLKEHMQFHSYDPPKYKADNAKNGVKCNLCDKMCTNAVVFKNHLFLEHSMLSKKSSAKKFPCQICGSRLTSPKIFEQHMKMHNREEYVKKAPPKRKRESSFDNCLCPICKVQYDNTLDYQHHFAIRHKDLPNHTRVAIKRGRSFFYEVCQYCAKTCYTKSQFVNHVKTHGKVPKIPKKAGAISGPGFKCYHCQVKFRTSHLLIKHKASHQKNRTLYCDQCSLTCPNASSLRKHYLMAHDKSLPNCLGAFKAPKKVDQKVYDGHDQKDCDDHDQNEYVDQQQNQNINLFEKNRTLYCDQCSLTCPHVSSLRKHYLMAHNKSLPDSLETFKGKNDDQKDYDDHGQIEYVDHYQNDYEDLNLQVNDVQKTNTLSFVDNKLRTENAGCESVSSFTFPNSEIPDIRIKIEPPDVRIKIEPPDVRIKIEPPDVRIKIEPPDVRIKIEPPDVRIKIEPPDVRIQIEPPDNRIQINPPDMRIKIEPPDDPETSFSMADETSENGMDFNEELIIPNYLDSD